MKAIPAQDILHVQVKRQNLKLSAKCQPHTHMLLVHHVIGSAKKRLRMGTCALLGTQAECQALARDINKKRHGEK